VQRFHAIPATRFPDCGHSGAAGGGLVLVYLLDGIAAEWSL